MEVGLIGVETGITWGICKTEERSSYAETSFWIFNNIAIGCILRRGPFIKIMITFAANLGLCKLFRKKIYLLLLSNHLQKILHLVS